MGAGKYRWWEEPQFARVESSATGIGGPTTLVVGGVYCGSGPKLQLELLVREINRAKHHRTLRMEAELERAAVRAVEIDRHLEAKEVLEAISDQALLAEVKRRNLLAYWREFPGEFIRGTEERLSPG